MFTTGVLLISRRSYLYSQPWKYVVLEASHVFSSWKTGYVVGYCLVYTLDRKWFVGEWLEFLYLLWIIETKEEKVWSSPSVTADQWPSPIVCCIFFAYFEVPANFVCGLDFASVVFGWWSVCIACFLHGRVCPFVSLFCWTQTRMLPGDTSILSILLCTDSPFLQKLWRMA